MAEPSLAEPGLYETLFVPHEAGGYQAVAVAMDANGVTVGTALTAWANDFAAEEFASLKPNRELMEKLAFYFHICLNLYKLNTSILSNPIFANNYSNYFSSLRYIALK